MGLFVDFFSCLNWFLGDHDDYYNYFEEPQSSKQKGQEEDNIVYEQLLYGEIVIRQDGQICVQVQGDVKDLSWFFLKVFWAFNRSK